MDGPRRSEKRSTVHTYAASDIVVTWDQERCLHFAECVRGLPEVFEPGRKPWVIPSNAVPFEVAEVIRRCPTGALHYGSPELPGEVGGKPTRVTPTSWGPILIRGELSINITNGQADIIQDTRMAACACRLSANPPFCDDSCRETNETRA